MSQEKNSESQDWIDFFQTIEKIMTFKHWTKSGIFGDIEAHFKSVGQSVDEKTLGKYYKEYEDSKTTKESVGSVIPNKSKISHVSVSEMNTYLRTVYSDVLNDKFNFKDFDYHYLYYYEGSQDYIKPAIICLKNIEDEFGNGVMYYLSKDKYGYKYNSTFELTRLSPTEGNKKNQKFIFYQAISNDYPEQVNTFTFNIFERPVDKRFLFFLTCNAISNTNLGKIASVNIGVVKRVEKNALISEINSEIDPWIKNVLIGKRLIFGRIESSVFTTEEKYVTDKESNDRLKTTNLQYTCCNILKGHYIGVYPRNEIPGITGNDNGGLAFVIMEFLEDGNASINFLSSSDSSLISYVGIFHFPHDGYKVIKGDFQILQPQVFRFSIYLNEITTPNKFGGIFSGFKNYEPSASPIMFYKLKDNGESLASLINKYKPGKISKYEIQKYFKSAFPDDWENWLNKVKADLVEISKKYIENINNCF